MIQIDDKIISTDILEVAFCCDLAHCKGICCVEGNAGAPLELEEVDTLEECYESYAPYMRAEGIEAVNKQGFMVVDQDGDLTTPLINDAECAYSFEENGTTFCAIERAWRAGECSFMKPISCHLYPIRVATFRNGTYGLNYHRWDVCSGALVKGKKEGIRVYESLRTPLIRRFGEEFYEALKEARKMWDEQKEEQA